MLNILFISNYSFILDKFTYIVQVLLTVVPPSAGSEEATEHPKKAL